MGEIARGTLAGAELLKNFSDLGDFDFLLVQEHKLLKEKIPFVNKRLKYKKAFWTPAKKGKKGVPKGGLAIFGDKFADRVVDAGVDTKNVFLWLTVVTEAGLLGVTNIYAGHSPAKRGKFWHRLLAAMDSSLPWIEGGYWNFVERRQDKKGGLRFCRKRKTSG